MRFGTRNGVRRAAAIGIAGVLLLAACSSDDTTSNGTSGGGGSDKALLIARGMDLLECLPRLDRRHEVVSAIPGTPPNPADLPPGCPFAPRCPQAIDGCTADEPALVHFRHGDVACAVVTAGATA